MASGVSGRMPFFSASASASRGSARTDPSPSRMKACVPKREDSSWVISDNFCSFTAAITQACVRHRATSGAETLANRPYSLATNAPHRRPSTCRRCSRAARTCGDFSASAGSRWIVPGIVVAARGSPADQVGRADQHRVCFRRRRKSADKRCRHRLVVDLELALGIELRDAVDRALGASHLGAQRILHRIDQKRRLGAEQVERVAKVRADRQCQHAADRQEHERAETQRHDDCNGNATPLLFRADQAHRLCRRAHAANVVLRHGNCKPCGSECKARGHRSTTTAQPAEGAATGCAGNCVGTGLRTQWIKNSIRAAVGALPGGPNECKSRRKRCCRFPKSTFELPATDTPQPACFRNGARGGIGVCNRRHGTQSPGATGCRGQLVTSRTSLSSSAMISAFPRSAPTPWG